MGIIDLDHCIIIQIIQIRTLCLCLIQNQASCVADHEILLINTKQASCVITIVRIQEQCQVLCDILFIKTNTIISNDGLVYSLYVEQMKLCGTILVSDYINVIHARFQSKSTKLNIISLICRTQPAVLGHPGIRSLTLQMIFEYLLE